MQDAQEKMTRLGWKEKCIGLKVNTKKTEMIRAPIALNGQNLKDIDCFVYLGSTMNRTGGAHEENSKGLAGFGENEYDLEIASIQAQD